jgi:hypothetical protein
MLTTLLAVPKLVGKEKAGEAEPSCALLPGSWMMAAAPEEALSEERPSCGRGRWEQSRG